MLLKARKGFTLVEIAIVLLIVSILLGYTVALFPRQQELKKYRALEQDMNSVLDAIVGFAQVNGRLPCPAIPDSKGREDGGGDNDCNNYGGFVPANTLGINGKLNQDSLLVDPWGNPYRYYVTNANFPGSDTGSDFVRSGEMRAIGLVDSNGDGYIDLDGQFMICDETGSSIDDQCTDAEPVLGRYLDSGTAPIVYAGAPFVLFSPGANWTQPQSGAAGGTATGDELENVGNSYTTTDFGMGVGDSGNNYTLKDVDGGETTFVRRPSGFADDFDDVVRWVSPNVLYSKMIEAGQLP